MACLKIFVLLSLAAAVVKPLAMTQPTTAENSPPFFLPSKKSEDWCTRLEPYKDFPRPPSMGICQDLRVSLQNAPGSYVVGPFDADEGWINLTTIDSCGLSAKPLHQEDAKDGARWLVGDADLYHIATESADMLWVMGGAPRVVVWTPDCSYEAGGFVPLMIRIHDSSDPRVAGKLDD